MTVRRWIYNRLLTQLVSAAKLAHATVHRVLRAGALLEIVYLPTLLKNKHDVHSSLDKGIYNHVETPDQ